jgi:uracil-DNA glycosylase
MDGLLAEIRECRVCESQLIDGCRPVLAASPRSKVLVIGQAPGRKVHESGIPWDDQSGKNLRTWLGVTPEQFYDPEYFAIIPMGFCFPGNGKSGDLPPRPECAPLWHPRLLAALPNVKLTLLIGKYAQDAYLGKLAKGSLTETVKAWSSYLPDYLPLPHPSPRNNIWQRKNPWFVNELQAELQKIIGEMLK